jgi:hypothetical protein
MERQLSPEPEPRKPSVLYHASRETDIEEFEPRNDKTRDPLDGPVVFATPDKAYATCFLVPTDDSWVSIGRWADDGAPGPWTVIVSDRQRFEGLDRGGVIYSLPSRSFSYHPERNMGETEWTSSVPVRPIAREQFESGLQAMKAAGVRVYFVDQATFDQANASQDHGKAIIESLEPDS